MDYSKHYNLLIEKSLDRIINGYTETHHIIPRCMGGTDDKDNLVDLTPEEHYVAHQLLVKIYPENLSLIYAAHMMGATRKNNKVYGWLKRKLILESTGKSKSTEAKKNMSKAKKGRPATGKPFKKGKDISGIPFKVGNIPWNKGKEHMSGEKNPAFGKIWSEEKRNKMSGTNKGRKRIYRDDGTFFYVYPHLENEVTL